MRVFALAIKDASKRTRTHTHAHTHSHARTHTHTPYARSGDTTRFGQEDSRCNSGVGRATAHGRETTPRSHARSRRRQTHIAAAAGVRGRHQLAFATATSRCTHTLRAHWRNYMPRLRECLQNKTLRHRTCPPLASLDTPPPIVAYKPTVPLEFPWSISPCASEMVVKSDTAITAVNHQAATMFDRHAQLTDGGPRAGYRPEFLRRWYEANHAREGWGVSSRRPAGVVTHGCVLGGGRNTVVGERGRGSGSVDARLDGASARAKQKERPRLFLDNAPHRTAPQ